MKEPDVCLSIKTLEIRKVQEKSFYLGTLLISAGDILLEHTEIQTTDTCVGLNYMFNIQWALSLNSKDFKGLVLHFANTSAKLKYVLWFFVFLSYF